MYEISISKLDQLIADGKRAAQYAWEHYEELIMRKKKYVLYGPVAYGIGAGIPGKFISPNSRKLQKQTRKKDYMLYELDSNFNLLQTTLMRNYTEIENTYYCFEFEGIRYACPFFGKQKKRYNKEILAIGFRGARPEYLGFLREHSLIAQFFHYDSPEKVLVTTYSYSPSSKYTVHGYEIDPNAPIGAPNSSVEKGFWEEVPAYTDFSEWFK